MANMTAQINHFVYTRTDHFRCTLDKYTGKKHTIPDVIVDNIRQDVLNHGEITLEAVQSSMRRSGCRYYYNDNIYVFSRLTGYALPDLDQTVRIDDWTSNKCSIKNLDKYVQEFNSGTVRELLIGVFSLISDAFKPTNERSSFLPYSYVLRKICDELSSCGLSDDNKITLQKITEYITPVKDALKRGILDQMWQKTIPNIDLSDDQDLLNGSTGWAPDSDVITINI